MKGCQMWTKVDMATIVGRWRKRKWKRKRTEKDRALQYHSLQKPQQLTSFLIR